jgi:hypothetical protein
VPRVLEGESLALRAAPLLLHPHERPAGEKLVAGIAGLLPAGWVRKQFWRLNAGVQMALARTGMNRRSPALVQLHDYIDVSEDEMRQTLTEEMGWQAPVDRTEHVDCRVEDVKRYIEVRKFPELTLGTIRRSALVRSGSMSRHDALALEGDEPGEPHPPATLEPFLEEIGLTRQEFEEAVVDWRRTEKYRG